MSHNEGQMRRAEREITDFDEIVSVLDKCAVMRLAMIAKDALTPYIVPLCFGYRVNEYEGIKSLTLFFHSAHEGTKVAALKKNPSVCFELDTDTRLIKPQGACGWSMAYKSVIGFGKARLLEANEQRRAALDEIMKHAGFEGKPEYQSAALEKTLVFAIDAAKITGKKRE
jgi:nitroimidazol reductase NimA-like FMN-containing flavoprotein (pyridoxamine 5'-phosphate oxidase superfamily)